MWCQVSFTYSNDVLYLISLFLCYREVGEKEIVLTNGEHLPYGFCLWAAGNGALPLVLHAIEQVPEQRQETHRGKLVVDEYLRVKGLRKVFALGDCSHQELHPLPATAQVASQQGAYLGRLFSKGYAMDTMAPTPVYKILDTEMYASNAAQQLHNGTEIGKFLEATNQIKSAQVSPAHLNTLFAIC